MKITTNIEKITPETAIRMLASNHSNQRNATIPHVLNLASQMRKGLWRMNGEPIILDSNGNILDGQHRLRAVVSADVTIDFLVVRGVSEDCFPTIDGGMRRTSGNIFQIAGIMNANAIAACVSGAMNYRRALEVRTKDESGAVICGGSLSTAVRASAQELIDEYRKHEAKYNDAVRIAINKIRHIMRPAAPAIIAALALIDGKMGCEWVDAFWEAVRTGENLTNTSPAYQLRERHLANKGARHRFSANHSVLLCAKAWNLYALEKPCRVLRLVDERAFPIL